jgi:hypothetical protein
MRRFSRMVCVSALSLVALVAGCVRYYQVNEPNGAGTTYYTTQVDELGSGSVRFKDMRTGSRVTMTSSQVKEIKEADLPPDLRPKK